MIFTNPKIITLRSKYLLQNRKKAETLVARVAPKKYNVPFSSFNRVNGLSKICGAKCQLEFIMIIRNEKPSDIEPITQVTIAAFKNCKYGNHTESINKISSQRASDLYSPGFYTRGFFFEVS
jgi:hypothetical protein